MTQETTTKPAIKPESQKSSPKDVFMHLLMIATLYVSTFSFISLWFDYINFLFPDPLNYYYQGILDGILWSTAMLIVVFPVYLLVSLLIAKDAAMEPEKHEIRVRKWLVYLTLFLAAIAIIVDVVTLVYNFLSGELSAKFFLKILVVLVVAGAVFGYYLWDVKRSVGQSLLASTLPRMLAWIVSAAVLGSVITSFFLVGSPAHQRDVRMDNKRINDLQMLQSQTINYWQQKEKLPTSLADLEDSISGFVPPVDPETGAAYEYIMKDSLVFDLCATFKTESVGTDTTGRYSKPLPIGFSGDPYSENWSHSAGRACFTRTIDPELYRINKPMPVMVR
ncbi:MAG: hypothetical protein HYT94_05410 [Parcubacteria group bacterium]|nr:hypothetical protein [Parcubacteria group bacterium]